MRMPKYNLVKEVMERNGFKEGPGAGEYILTVICDPEDGEFTLTFPDYGMSLFAEKKFGEDSLTYSVSWASLGQIVEVNVLTGFSKRIAVLVLVRDLLEAMDIKEEDQREKCNLDAYKRFDENQVLDEYYPGKEFWLGRVDRVFKFGRYGLVSYFQRSINAKGKPISNTIAYLCYLDGKDLSAFGRTLEEAINLCIFAGANNGRYSFDMVAAAARVFRLPEVEDA